jgi:hypothetical protein
MKGYNMTNNKNNNPAYNWDLYLKQCQEVAASSITPYEIIPYKKYNGIKQAIVKKQNTFKEALTNEIKKRGFDTSRIEIITIG